MRQLHTLVNVLSDAKLSEQNLFMLYIDFSSACNTIDHDKLLQIMYDIGFPTDAINVIEDMYTNATTQVKPQWAPMGKTDAVHINRGTIQGDSLSPLKKFLVLDIHGASAQMAQIRGQRLPVWVPQAKHSWESHNLRHGVCRCSSCRQLERQRPGRGST